VHVNLRGQSIVTLLCSDPELKGIDLLEKETLVQQMKKACGCGGTVKAGRLEIQGDKREAVARILREAGFEPVFAGG
jgi:translation initiation factor 1